ncbi:MAG: DinB family protein [candidate division Zixibacteria bacterium]|nr:DinB family protein [candidate division Zixibacteria bacterium]
MDSQTKEAIWLQCGAAIDSLESAIRSCPEHVWGDRSKNPEFWYVAYHTIFWLDFYSSETVEKFAPPEPFGMEEMDPAGLLPPRVYSRQELLAYLAHSRQKYKLSVQALNAANAHLNAGAKRPELTNLEMVFYTMRHLQHHTAQLNLLLRQTIDDAPRWVKQAKDRL